MNLDARKARAKEFHDVLEKAMARYQDVLAPARCAEHKDPDCDPAECEFEPEPVLIRTWALVFGCELLEPIEGMVGVNEVDTFTPEGSMSWEIAGLLRMAERELSSPGCGE